MLNMKGIKTSQIYLSQIFFALFASTTASSISLPSQKIWLSEYGYLEETSEKFKQASFPVLQTENIFSNSFLSKNDTEVVVHGNLSFIVFTCKATYPIFWSVKQEMKDFSESLMTKTYQFQSSSNVSKDPGTTFRSLIYIYLDQSEYYFDTGEYFPSNSSGKWEFSCHKFIDNNVHSRIPSITLKFKQKSDNEISSIHSLNLEERIPILLFKKDYYNTTVKSSGYSLNYLRRDFPNFYAYQNQQIILNRNYTIDMVGYEDTLGEDSKLVENQLNENVTEGDPIQILCFSNKKLYSYGTYVKIEWENGTEIRVSEEHYGFSAKPGIYFSDNSKFLAEKLFLLEDASEEDMLYFLSKEIQVELGMKQISCYMPIWVNGKWDKVSKEINIVPKKSNSL